jgi:hypothetical protein
MGDLPLPVAERKGQHRILLADGEFRKKRQAIFDLKGIFLT